MRRTPSVLGDSAMASRDPSLVNALRDAALLTARRSHLRAALAARRGIRLPSERWRRRRRNQIWAIAMVKNERDVIAGTVDHLLAQGVDRLLIADNGSTDGTLEWLLQRARHAPLTVVRDREPAYHQAEKMTRLARWAARRGAGWIVPFDADERWLARGASLAAFLRAQDVDVLTARIYNVFPVGGSDEPPRLRRLDLTPHRDVKVAFRAHPGAILLMGNHAVVRPGRASEGLFIVHLPWRSEEQVAAKVRGGIKALQAAGHDDGVGTHWHAMGVQGDEQLHEIWEQLLEGVGDPVMTWCPRGPFLETDAVAWATWDPEGVTGA